MGMNILRSILVVDPSKVVRAALAKHLKDSYFIRDESDGEQAWQTLILDSSIVAVLSGINLPRLDAYGLIARLRSNKLRRLQEMPILLLGSGRESDDERALAIQRGAAGFVNKTMGKAEIVARVTQLAGGAALPEEDDHKAMTATDVCGSAMLQQAENWPELEPEIPPPEPPLLEPVFKPIAKPLLSATEFREKISAVINPDFALKSSASIIIFGLDNLPALADEYGTDMVKRIGEKISGLLRNKIGPADNIGQLRAGCVAILAIGSGLQASKVFAEKVCSSLASAKIGSVSTRIPITVSAGVASLPQDGKQSGESLLLLSHHRLCAAIEKGGNQVVSEGKGMPQTVANPEVLIARALSALRLKQTDEISPYLATAGLQILPLLAALDKQYGFGLPLPEVEAKLEQTAMTEWVRIFR